MKGYIAMQKMDLIDDEYIREADIGVDTAVVFSEKRSFWQKLSRFMNSPVGVAMLCAVVSLSVLAAIVMAGTGKWGEWFPPAGTSNEQTSVSENTDTPPTQDETLPPVETLDAKSFVPEFYQALKDKDMIGKIPDPAVDGGLKASDDPMYIVKEENIHNTTPLEIYEETGALIFDAGVMVYLWMDGEIYILNQRVVWGSGFTGAVLCDYDQNGTEDIFCGYITSLSGVWYTDFVVFDVTDKALRHNLRRVPSDNSSMVIGYRIFCNYGIIQKRTTDGKDYYDLYEAGFKQEGDSSVLTPEKLHITLTPSPQGLLPISGGEYQDPIPTINLIPNTDINKITQCLVDHGFGATLDSGEFLDKVLTQYRYLGIPLTNYRYKSFHHDLPEEEGRSERGWAYEGKSVNYKWSHRSLADDEYTRTGNLGGKTIITGLTLPYSLRIGDTYAQVFQKMGAEELTLTDTTTVLYENDRITLTLKSTPEASDYTHHLVYAESFFYVHRIVISDVTVRSRDVNAKRTLTISFLPDGTLGYFNMEVQETFSPETIELLTPPPVEEITSPEEAAQMKAKVYATLDKLHFYSDMHPTFYVPVYWDQDLYDTYFRPLGKEATPYILQYVMESSYSKFPKDGINYSWAWEDDFWNMYYFVGAAYALIGMPEPSDGWYGFQSLDYVEAHEYAAELYKHLHEHINTDPALWGSYTPAEDAISRLELLPLNATMTKEITEAFFDTMIPESEKKHCTAEDLSIRYYGYYDQGYVVFVDGILEYTEAFETEEIAGYVFEYNSGQKLLYYKNGHFYTLTEADYILSDNSLRTLYEVYTQK